MFRFLLPLGLAVLFFNPAIAQTPPAGASGREALPPVPAPETASWTLADSVRRALDSAPEMRAAEAGIAARAGELSQAGSWPNPTLDVRADNKLGIEDGSGGTDLTQIALSQPLPLRRLSRQRAAAQANLESAQENRSYQRLLLEREVARVYHALQLASARRQLAEERQRLVAETPATAGRSGAGRLVRYLSPLERRRLSIISEEASQALVAAEREQQKALIDFRILLSLPPLPQAQTAQLLPPPAPAGLDTYAGALDAHPSLLAAQKEAAAAQAEIEVAESQRYADPTLNLFRERDFLAGARRDVTGVGVSVQLPLWNTSSGTVAKARAEAERAQARLEMAQRDARSRLELAHTQLVLLLEQSERLRKNLLTPAQEVFTLTRRGFAVGEFNVLTLVDANNTYFDALARHLELQYESQLAAADLRLAAGISVLETSPGVAP
jgi:cobalt-zinc-cadmium efflux system outer membrane protein